MRPFIAKYLKLNMGLSREKPSIKIFQLTG